MAEKSFAPQSTALVQGASRGIGLALVRELGRRPAWSSIVACCRDPASASELSALADDSEGRVQLQRLDVTDVASIEAVAERIRDDDHKLSLVMNVAGILHDQGLGPEKRIEDLDWHALQRVFAVNALGPAMMLRHFLPLMRGQDRAVFAAVSARVGSIEDNRLGGWYAYRASKAALNQFLKTASVEAGRRFRNVIVAALHPGTTDTGLSEPFQANVPEGKLFSTEFVAERLVSIVEGFGPEDNGCFRDWDNQPIPW